MYKKVKVKALLEGMILGQDILGGRGQVLISRGKRIDSSLLNYLDKNFSGEDFIVIHQDEEAVSFGLDASFDDSNLVHASDLQAVEKNYSPMPSDCELSLAQTQDIIKNVFSSKEEFKATKALVSRLKEDVVLMTEGFIKTGDIQDRDFTEIAENVVGSIDNNLESINPAYLYLLEMEKWDPSTFNHSIEVAFFSLSIANSFSKHKGELTSFFLAGLLHDIGKYIYYKSGETKFYELITKQGALSPDEFDLIKRHVDVEQFFKNKFLFLSKKEQDNIMYGALDHHEKMDGSGYLNAKRGMHISLAGRVIAVCDIYDALIRKRSYKTMIKPNIAMNYILEMGKSGKLDSKYVNMFHEIMGTYPIGSVIETSKGPAIVTAQSKKVDRPIVFLVNESGIERNLSKDSSIEILENSQSENI